MNWNDAPLNELIDYIFKKHHGYLKEELPYLGKLVKTIYRVHGGHHPELTQVFELFNSLKADLDSHLSKEGTLQYPVIEKYLESKSKEDLKKAINIIDELVNEHIESVEILSELRKVTRNYVIPDDVCPTFELTYQKIQELEADLFEHIQLENNILFPRLRELLI